MDSVFSPEQQNELDRLKASLLAQKKIKESAEYKEIIDFAFKNPDLISDYSWDRLNSCYLLLAGQNNPEFDKLSKISFFGGSTSL